jgi:hypothetical protein
MTPRAIHNEKIALRKVKVKASVGVAIREAPYQIEVGAVPMQPGVCVSDACGYLCEG